ncbi:MAG: hypothetical protein LBV60_05765 [Streptomyces sp.]|nr:hypothetical protein [Streptomyces sp.]
MALSFGVALAAGSDDGPTPAPSTEEVDTPSPWDPTSGTSGGVDGGTDPVPTQTSITEAPLPTGDPTSPTSEPEPDLAELNRRISQLDKKIDQLPKKKELADALRAFADELDKSE